MADSSFQLIKYGTLVVALQNVLWLLNPFIGLGNLVLYIDLLGFALLGVGLLLYGQNFDKSELTIAGVATLGWLVARVIWQFIIVGGLGNASAGTDPVAALDDFVNAIQNMVLMLLISSVLLLIGSYFYMKGADEGGSVFFAYGVCNFIATFLFARPFFGNVTEETLSGATFGLFSKLLIIPILGVIFFFIMFSKTDQFFPEGSGDMM